MTTGGFDPRAWVLPFPLPTDPATAMAGAGRLARSVEPAAKAAARAGLEVQGLANRRLQAWIEIPAKAARCRSPGDAIAAQAQFWRTAAEQYTESSKRIAECWAPVWSALLPAAGANGWWGGIGRDQVTPERDLITFPEPKEPAGASQAKPGGRRAA